MALESRRYVHRDTAHELELSWREARQVAADWLAANGYTKKRDVRGEFIDLQALSGSLGETGKFREMVIQAAGRLLKKRGAESVILPD
jgi:hypothetical protein